MKGQFPRVVLQSVKGQTVLSTISGLFSFFWLALVGFDLSAPHIKPPVVPGFHAGAWEAAEGKRPHPWCLRFLLLLQKYSHILHLCSIYLLGQQV